MPDNFNKNKKCSEYVQSHKLYYLMGVTFNKCLKKLTRNTYKIGRGSQLNERHQNEMSVSFSMSLFKNQMKFNSLSL